MGGDGTLDQCAWTQGGFQGFDDAWLALDRDRNGQIDNGLELFGNFTEQPPSSDPNGFRALAVMDDPANGGNGDGVIDAQDRIYPYLRLWRDTNHDGISESSELLTLTQVGLIRIERQYQVLDYTDPVGNVFRFKGRTHFQNAPQVRATWDIFLKMNP
jgi:hypothetical protein